MNTIEMLKELYCTGNPFETDVANGYYTMIDRVGAVIMCKAGEEHIKFTLELNAYYMNCTWKPYVKPEDWSKVPIDTKVIVTTGTGAKYRRYFNKVIDGKPTVFEKGRDSFTTIGGYEWFLQIELYENDTE